uniref:histone acetyltransferase n=1 Tax=Caenorhabditis tropicalis TaxID=1561998 RepID=A0A1I7TLC1_9PELO
MANDNSNVLQDKSQGTDKNEMATTSSQASSGPGPIRNRKAKQQKKMLLCCQEKEMAFTPVNLPCDGAFECKITQQAPYFIARPGTGEKQFCERCFKRNFPVNLLKKNFVKRKNSHKESEAVLECRKCQEKIHKMCSFYYEDDDSDFECHNCRQPNVTKTVENIPTNDLDRIMTEKINDELKKFIGAEEAVQFKITVLNVHNAESSVPIEEVSPANDIGPFKQKYGESLSFTSRTFLAFQRNDGTGWLVLDYVDSVHHVTPLGKKGHLYQTILLSYWEFMAKQGFNHGYIWAKPPIKGDDYIFHVHPEKQHLLNQKQLEKWYITFFHRGCKEGIIKEFRTFDQEKNTKNIQKPIDLPVFKDSLWPIMFNWAENDEECPDFQANLEKFMELHNEDNFIIDFVIPPNSPVTATPPDIPLRNCPQFGCRDEFINLCSEKNWEFGSLRRAKYSSVGLIGVLTSCYDNQKADANELVFDDRLPATFFF